MARHYASKKARRDEHMGMERYERGPVERVMGHMREEHNDEMKHSRGSSMERSLYIPSRMGPEPYAGIEGRRTQEMEDAGMIREDMRAIANLPQEVMIKPYPRTGPYLPEGLNDNIEGIDHQMDFDDSQRRKHFFPKKV